MYSAPAQTGFQTGNKQGCFVFINEKRMRTKYPPQAIAQIAAKSVS